MSKDLGISITYTCDEDNLNARRRDGSIPRCPKCRKDMTPIPREERLNRVNRRKKGRKFKEAGQK